jgi:diguanylate cyclase (GGDEF)-like protein
MIRMQLDTLLAPVFRGDQRSRLIALVVLVLGTAFLAVAILSYLASRERLHDVIVSKELPLTSELVYTEIQRDFSKPLQASAVMAGNTFMRDWAMAGEHDLNAVQSFLAEMQRINGAFSAYFISDKTHRYYTPKGILKTVAREDAHDDWFFALRNIDEPYVVEVDTDQNHDNALTVFINYRVFDDAKNFIGIAGLGLNVDAVRTALDHYQKKFDLEIYFVDKAGKIVMSGGNHDVFDSIDRAPGLSELGPDILGGKDGAMEYFDGKKTHLLNVRYMPELNWYLFVERIEEAATVDLRQTLYINLLIAALATAVVAAILWLVITRFRGDIDRLATTDSLTGLINRRAFDVLFRQAARAGKRANSRLSLVLFDIDHMQQINEKLGHSVGDQAIKLVAAAIDGASRANDIVCRWGGDQILLLLQDCKLSKAMAIADGIRAEIERLKTSLGQPVTVSAGIAEMSGDDNEQPALARADAGLQTAKGSGGNCIISSGHTF